MPHYDDGSVLKFEVVEKQPDHGSDQVKSVDELVINEWYQAIWVTAEEPKQLAEISPDKTKIRFEEEEKFHSLRDCGVIPYETGWNSTNWLKKVEAPTQEKKEK